MAVLVRPVFMAFPPMLVALSVYYFHKRGVKQPYCKYAVYLFLALALNTGWSVHNNAKFGEQSMSGNGLKEQVLLGSYPDFIYKDPRFKMEPYKEDPNYYKVLYGGYGAIFDYLGGKFALEPARHLSWYLRKPIFFWTWNIYGGLNDPRYGVDIYYKATSWFDKNVFAGFLREWMVKMQPVLVFMALGGIVFSVVRKRLFQENLFYLVPLGLLTSYTLIFVFLSPAPRYSLPLGSVLYAMAISLPWQWGRFFKKSRNG